MTIPVVCPHCDSTYQLAPDLAGKAMRCPNPDCREVFTVPAAGPPLPPTRDAAPTPAAERPYERVESSPFTVIPEADPDGGLPAITAARLQAAKPPPPRELTVKRPGLELDPFTVLPEADPDGGLPAITAALLPPAPKLPLPAKKPAPPKPAGPKEKVWAGDAPPPPKAAGPKPAAPPAVTVADDDEPADFVRTTRPHKRRGGTLLLASLGLLVLVGTGGGLALLRFFAKSEQWAAEGAAEAYKDGNFLVSKTRYTELGISYPSSKDAERYRFFAALSDLRLTEAGVTLKDDPAPGRKAFDAFVAEWGANPLALPESGFGTDVLDAGKRLLDATADHGDGRLKGFQADRTKLPELDAVEAVARGGLELVPGVDRFRDRQAGPLDAQRGRFDALLKGVAGERHRLAVLLPYRDLPQEPTALRIEQFQDELKREKLDTDAEAEGIRKAAEVELWKRITYTKANTPAPPAPAEGEKPLLFSVAPADRLEPTAAAGGVPGVLFAVARGVLVALDADTGRPRWGVRVAAPTADPQALDLPARVGTGDGEWALVVSEADGGPALTARTVDGGQVVWRQPLEAPAAGRAVVAAGRVYLPLRDPLGTVAEFDAASGARTGQVQLRQPVGGGIAVGPGGKPGQFHLFVPGDSKRVFVFEVGRAGPTGDRLPPRPVKALLTDHPRDGLRCEPVVAAGGDGDGPRTLVLCQGDGPPAMKVRAFALPPAADWADTAASPADAPTARPTEVSLPGQAWTPPVTDGERLLVATDAPAVLAFGLQQPGTLDRPLFALPGPKPAGEQEGVSRSQVVAADEDGCWAVLGGQLQRLVLKVDPAGGPGYAPGSPPVRVGEPLHRPQARGTLAVVVTRLDKAGAIQATGFDTLDGRVRWQRRLGLLPAGPAVASAAGAVLADEDGGIYLLPDGAAAPTALAPPLPAADGKAVSVTAGDGAVWVLAAGTKPESRQLRVRRVQGGKLTDDRAVPLPADLAGPPAGFGADVLLPLGNGSVWRLAPGADKLDLGPLWRGGVGLEGATCFVAAVGPDEFGATDGAARWLHWKWSAGSKPEKVAGPYSAAGPLASAPVRLDTPAGPRFVSVELSGAVGLWDPTRLTAPIRRWAADEGVPAGKPSDRAQAVQTPAGMRVVLGVDRRLLVAIDPEADKVAWTVEAPADAGELVGWRAEGAKVVATDQTGRVLVFDAATGKSVGEVPATAGGPLAAAPQAAGVVVYADGTAGRVPLP